MREQPLSDQRASLPPRVAVVSDRAGDAEGGMVGWLEVYHCGRTLLEIRLVETEYARFSREQ
jgi:hypothetical protein